MSVDNQSTPSLSLVCTRDNLRQGLGMVSRVSTTKSSLPILANIHLLAKTGQLQLSATDLEIGVTTSVGAKVQQSGSITIPARLFVDFVSNNTDETISLTVNGTEITLTSDHYTARIPGLEATDFPSIPHRSGDERIHLKAKALRGAFEDVTFAAAFDDSRPVLNGVLVSVHKKGLTVVATDSYRLAERTLSLDATVSEPRKVIVPSRSASELIRLLPSTDEGDASLTLTTGQLGIEFGETQVISRLVEGTYPDYTQIIPTKPTTTVTARRADCQAAVKMANLFARDASHHIRLVVGASQSDPLSIKAVSANVGTNQATIEAEVDGEPIESAVNATFLQDALNATTGELVTFAFVGADRPVVIRGQGETHYLNLVMPLRLDA